jgi:hypothetical protein
MFTSGSVARQSGQLREPSDPGRWAPSTESSLFKAYTNSTNADATPRNLSTKPGITVRLEMHHLGEYVRWGARYATPMRGPGSEMESACSSRVAGVAMIASHFQQPRVAICPINRSDECPHDRTSPLTNGDHPARQFVSGRLRRPRKWFRPVPKWFRRAQPTGRGANCGSSHRVSRLFD